MKANRKTWVTIVFSVILLFGANAVLGGPKSEQAIQAFDQHLIDAWAGARKAKQDLPHVNGFSIQRRIPVFVFSYYFGQSVVADREISCASRHSVVLWYGAEALLMWQDGLWFPDRSAIHQKYARTGLVR